MDWKQARRRPALDWGYQRRRIRGLVKVRTIYRFCCLCKHKRLFRWYTKHPLHLSSSPTPLSPPPSVNPKRLSRIHSSPEPATRPNRDDSNSLAASVIAADPPVSSPQSSFTTALTMLLYDVSYLANTQNVEVPLSQTGDVLSNLWMVCCSSELGR
jgi:hypothetical protein